MKKTIAIVLCAVLFAMSLAGCGSSASGSARAASSASGSTASPADSKKPGYTLRFGHTLTENDTFHKAMVAWSEAVLEHTGGDVKIEIYPNAELGSEEDVLEQMRQGANIGWQTDFARAGSYVNELSVMNAPYFIENIEEVKALQKSENLNGWLEQLSGEFGLKALSFEWVQGNRVVYSNKKALNPSEMSAMSIRAANAPIWQQSVNALGCTAVALAYSEIYSSIQTKVIDGCELPYNAALNLKINEVCKNIIETNHIYQMNLMLVSDSWWNTLPDEYKTILVEDCNAAGLTASQELADTAAQSKQALMDAGMNLIPYEELDVNAFKAASQRAYDALDLADARAAVYGDIGKTVVS